MMVESMSATSSRLRRPSTGWIAAVDGSASAGRAASAARIGERRFACRAEWNIAGLSWRSQNGAVAGAEGRAYLVRDIGEQIVSAVCGNEREDMRHERIERQNSMSSKASEQAAVTLIAGPTASGKSALAMRLARRARRHRRQCRQHAGLPGVAHSHGAAVAMWRRRRFRTGSMASRRRPKPIR